MSKADYGKRNQVAMRPVAQADSLSIGAIMADSIEYSGEEHFKRHVVKIDIDEDTSIFRSIMVPVGDYTTQEEIDEYIEMILDEWAELYES